MNIVELPAVVSYKYRVMVVKDGEKLLPVWVSATQEAFPADDDSSSMILMSLDNAKENYNKLVTKYRNKEFVIQRVPTLIVGRSIL